MQSRLVTSLNTCSTIAIFLKCFSYLKHSDNFFSLKMDFFAFLEGYPYDWHISVVDETFYRYFKVLSYVWARYSRMDQSKFA